MIIHHLRNATFAIQSGNTHILVDPMLGPKGSLPAFARFRHPPRPNPLVDLPKGAEAVLGRVNFCMVTHCQKWGVEALTHTDHLDSEGMAFLANRNIPVACPEKDRRFMERKGIRVAAALRYWQGLEFAGGNLTAVPARHGQGWIHGAMANGAGFFLELPNEPSIYISGDTVYTRDVDRALREMKPDIAVVAAGSASLDVGGPILMPEDEILRFVETAPGRVVANHLEALNHCPTSRKGLKARLAEADLGSKVLVPDDGDCLVLDPVLGAVRMTGGLKPGRSPE